MFFWKIDNSRQTAARGSTRGMVEGLETRRGLVTSLQSTGTARDMALVLCKGKAERWRHDNRLDLSAVRNRADWDWGVPELLTRDSHGNSLDPS